MPYATRSPVQRTYKGRFTGINGASPTSYSLDPGVSVTRTGEGVYRINLPPPVAGFKSIAMSVNDTGEVHELSWATSVPNRTVTITHKTCAYADVATGPVVEDVVAEVHFTITVEESDTIGAGI